ncbi:MAG TPA: PBS lyase [Cyanobacteria bacterium UBA8803]|nr:PBS lyase [Cyanobacteria bacterium UBA9273]HBL59558.1 PBS lyase [Cyanobacteria bacterium UBA8803]
MITQSGFETQESDKLSLDLQQQAVCQFLADVEEHFKYKILLHSHQPIARKTLYIPLQVTLERNYRHEVETFWGYAESEAELKRAYTLKGRQVESKRYQVPWTEAKKQHQKLMVLADPGMGKSALLRREAALTAADERQKLFAASKTIEEVVFPLFIRLADLDETGAEIIDAIPKLVQRDYPKTHAGIQTILQKKLRAGKCLLLLNALDEVPKTNRNLLSDKINRFLDQHPCPVICTSRIVGYGGAFINGAKEVEIVPFSQQQIEKFIETWCEQAAGALNHNAVSAQGLIEELRHKPQLRGLARNPRLLYLLCSLYQEKALTLPARRCQIYEKTVDYLLSKGSTSQESGRDNTLIKAKIQLLEDLAYRFTCQGKDIFSSDELKHHIGEYLSSEGVKSDLSNCTPEELLAQLSGENGILHKLATESDRYVFIHRITQDYLTACYLKRAIQENGDRGIALARAHFWEYDWHQALSLLAGLMPDPLPLLEAIAKEKDDIFSTLLLLAGRAIAERADTDERQQVPREIQALIAGIIHRIYQLWHTYPFVGFIASTVVALGQGNSQMLQLLQTELGEKHYYTRKDFVAAAIAALGQIGSPEAVEALIKTLNQGPWYVRAEAAAALGQIGTAQALQALISALHDEDTIVRGEVAQACGRIGTPPAIKALILALHDQDSYVRGEATVALAQIGTPPALEELIKVLNHPDSFVRWEATGACRISSPAVVQALIKALNHHDSTLREEAAVVLGRIGTSKAIEALVPALQDTDSIVREEAAEAIARTGNPQTLDALLPTLHDQDSIVRAEATQALGRIGNPQLIEVLIPVLQDPDSLVRKHGAEALGEIGTNRAVNPLIQALRDQDGDVRGAAATALGRIGTPIALNVLIPVLQDRDWFVREQAAIALSRIGTPETLEKLLQLPERDIYRPEIFTLIRTLAVRFSRERMPLIPVYPELIGSFGFLHRLGRKWMP